MRRFNVTGMSCAACTARVEKAVKSVAGVNSCTVNLLTNSMLVEGKADTDSIISAVSAAGYGASLMGEKNGYHYDVLGDKETPKILKRFLASIIFLIVLMYVSMGHMMWGWPLPKPLADNYIAQGLIQLLLSAIIMVINQKIFINGFKSFLHRSPNMDSLIAMGSFIAFTYSTYALFTMIFVYGAGNYVGAAVYMQDFYFESAAMILTLITLGKMLEARSKGKTTNALKDLVRLAPKTTTVIREGKEIVIPAESTLKGDVFIVRPGESIPVDGVVLDGESYVNEAAITGESLPVSKKAGDSVSVATINGSGFLRCEATAVGEDTTLSKIIKMVSDAAATKAPIAKVADTVSGVFVPAVIGISIFTFIIWLIVGQTFGYALARAISVLVISCPCALGLATPVAIMVGSGVGARNGILFKTAVSLEQAGRTNIVVLDKTGTITKGEPTVTDIITADGVSVSELLGCAASLEKKSEHPLAAAILKRASEENIVIYNISDFNAVPGKGLTAIYNGEKISGGNFAYISSFCNIPYSILNRAEELERKGKTALYFCSNNIFLGIVAVADVIKDDSESACNQLKTMGIRVVMLTGDNQRTAKSIGEQIGIDEIISDLLPNEKESIIRKLKKEGHVAMVGDGINDAPALTSADVGIAIGAGTDIAIDAADIVLMKNNLSDVPAAISISKSTLKTIHQNLFWAFIYNIIGIPLAAGVFVFMLGWEMNPMIGAAAMSLSSFSVVANALRLNFLNTRLKKISKQKKQKLNGTEEQKMEIIMKVEGMMCPHCEAHVKKTIEDIKGVISAEASHKRKEVLIVAEANILPETFKKAIEDIGYTVIE